MQHESTHADHYRATAKDCEERAASAPDPETRRVYEDMARQWLALAQQAEQGGGGN